MRGTYLRLIGLVEASHKEIEANPWPVLDKSGAEIFRLRALLDEICVALYPMSRFVPEDGPIEFHNPTADMYAKIEAIKAIIEKL
jgi:hypothetical protein